MQASEVTPIELGDEMVGQRPLDPNWQVAGKLELLGKDALPRALQTVREREFGMAEEPELASRVQPPRGHHRCARGNAARPRTIYARRAGRSQRPRRARQQSCGVGTHLGCR